MRIFYSGFFAAVSFFLPVLAQSPSPTPTANQTPTQYPAPIVVPSLPTATPIAVPSIPTATPAPTQQPTPAPTPDPIKTETPRKGKKLSFRINLDISDNRPNVGSGDSVIRTTVQMARGESVVLGGTVHNVCHPPVCNAEKVCQPAQCEDTAQTIKMIFTDIKNDVVYCRFEIVGPKTEKIGFVVTGKVNSKMSYTMKGDLRVKLFLTPNEL